GGEAGYIFIWLSTYENEISQVAPLYHADLISHQHSFCTIACGAKKRFLRRVAKPLHKMIKVARICAVGSPREAIVPPDQHTQTSFSQRLINVSTSLHLVGKSARFRLLARDAPSLTFEKHIVQHAKGWSEKHPILVLLQHFDRAFVRIFAMIDEIDAAFQTELN